MAQGVKTKEELITEKMNECPQIDTSVDIRIPRSTCPYDESKKHKFKCISCGKGFTKQDSYFNKSNDVLFQSNNGYLPWCKDCVSIYVTQMTALYSGNEELGMKDFCQRAGWNYDLSALIASRETFSGHRDRHRILHYAAKKNLNCSGRKTFIDTIKYNYENQLGNIITSKEQTKSDDISVTATAIDRWGVGFTELDYKNLEDHYRMLKKNNPNADNNQEIFIKTLCNLNMLMIRALQSGNSKEYSDLADKYSKTFKDAGLKTIAEKDNSNDECVGVTLATISQYTPEEYYKDKKLFSDFDDIGDYYDRHILRPMRNLILDEDVRDKEFYVHEVDDDEE